MCGAGLWDSTFSYANFFNCPIDQETQLIGLATVSQQPHAMAQKSQQSPSLNATIKHLRAFLSVARNRSFTRAGIELHLSQPTLTMIIRQLEDIVGASLFERTTRTIALTPEGSDFMPTAERLVYDFDMAIQDIQAAATRRSGRIGVALVHAVATKVIPDVLRFFTVDHPRIRLHLRDGNSSEVRRRVRRNEVDVGFCSKGEDDPELDFKPLFRDQMGLLLRRDHAIAKVRPPLRWNDVEGTDFIGLTQDTATASLLTQLPAPTTLMSSPRFQVSMNSTLWALLEAGIGVTTVPALAVFGGAGGNLVFRQIKDPIVWRTVYVVTRRGRSLSPPIHDLIARVRDRISAISATTPLVEVLSPVDR
ncbi:MAG: LysR family transcriptional regulator [Chelatococcus sp.]|uniref:LysR family transcriptional regulator n=2 Tax=Chelatococcus sp. TaxID=1953771 RepID=UPI0025B7D5EC|nr:LysR family transcriptional regulator [Chelatococcus sp.]MBX3538145.1 LysR family transcriptional regulator [Chelatococcus sp.]